MKSIASFAVLMLLSTSKAVKLSDIFDAYDEESLIEQNSTDDSIDPEALAVEIGGEEIAREVQGATKGIKEEASLL